MNQSVAKGGLRRDLLIALSAALALRLIYLVAIRRAIDMADAIHYINMAKLFAAGDFANFDENLPILYPLLGAAAHLVLPNWEHAFWAVSLTASTLLVVPVYLIASELHGRSAARLSVLFIAIWPWLVDYGSRIAPEALAVFFWFLSLYLVYRAIMDGGYAVYVAPVSLFALHLTRPEGTFLMLSAPLAAFLLCYKSGEGARYKRCGLFTASCAVLLAAYAFAMKFALGTATVSYRAPMVGDLSDYFRRGAYDGARTFMQLSFDTLPVMLGPLFLIFLGVGLFHPKSKTPTPRLALLVVFFCLVQWTLTIANFSPAPRYLMAIVVALSMWSAKGMVVVIEQSKLPSHRLRYWPVALTALSMFVGLAADIVPQYLGGTPKLPIEYREAGLWMRENLEPGLIISRKPQVGFYANMPTIGPGAEDSPEDVIALAKEIGARYLVLDERYSIRLAPRLATLLDPSTAPEGLAILANDLSQRPNARIAIYKFDAPGMTYRAPDEIPSMSSHRGPDKKRRISSAQ